MVLLENTVNSKEIKFSYNCIPPRYNLCYYCSIRFNVLTFNLGMKKNDVVWKGLPNAVESESVREVIFI